MCPNSDAATAIDAYGVRGCYADVAELGQASRAFEAVAGEDRGNIVRDHFPPVERVADVSDAERIEDLSDLSDEQLDRMREVRDEARRKNKLKETDD